MKLKSNSVASEKSAAARRYATDAARWNAIVQRDARADGAFYYSVSTTGVYCRPSCAARQALRRNVQFHPSCEAAERVGFRACKRCHPNGPTLEQQYATTVTAACRMIESAETPPALDDLAKAAGLSRFHFHRVFTRLTGVSPKAFAMARQADRVRTSLPKRGTITEAIYAAGYNSNSRFYAKSGQLLGMKPKRFRAGGVGEVIRSAVAKCDLGCVLAATSQIGVCAIALGDDAAELIRELHERFPQAEIISGDRAFQKQIARVVRLVESPGVGLDLPLDVRGTAFQRRVWQALCKIPVGATVNYTEIARRIGAPKAVRAVASACAANALAVAIPCHRVVRTDGKLAGYRWGVKRKAALLHRERAAASAIGKG